MRSPETPVPDARNALPGWRPTGIDVIGDSPEGIHFCQFYQSKEEIIEILVPYFTAGLRNDEACIWVTSGPLTADESWDALRCAVPDLDDYRRRGRIDIVPHDRYYVPDGRLDAAKLIRLGLERLDTAISNGCTGLRLSGTAHWLESDTDWAAFAEYEAAVDAAFAPEPRIIALCCYPLERCGAAEIADVIRNHRYALLKRGGAWQLIGNRGLSEDRDRLEALARERTRELEAINTSLGFLSHTATELLQPLGAASLFRFLADRIYSIADGSVVAVSEFDAIHRQTVVRELRSTPAERDALIRLLGREAEGIALKFLEETRERILPGELVLLDGLYDLAFEQLPLPLCEAIERELAIGDVYAMACATDDDILGTIAIMTHNRESLRNKKLIESVVTQGALSLKRIRTEEALVEAGRRKDEFLAVLSHELRNPLAPIRNSLYVLERATPGGEQARRAQGVIERQVAHLARLVDDLLDVTRIARGKMQLRHDRLELGEVVRRTVEDHREVFTTGNIALDAVITTRPLWMYGDATRLSQAVGNLLQNAAKFTPLGGRVQASLLSEGDTAVLRVQDTGVGIAPEMLGRIFEPFTQAEQGLDRRLGGLGLGLALVKGLVEHHGGAIEASSDGAGRGATFTVRLPLDLTLSAEPPTPAAATAARRRRVLVIEDNVDAAESLREALALGGHEVAVAYSGPDGIENTRAFGPEVVICDIGLPGMDGYAVARALRADPATRDVFLVALTGYAQPEDAAQAVAAGFDRHIAKPPGLDELEEILASLPER